LLIMRGTNKRVRTKSLEEVRANFARETLMVAENRGFGNLLGTSRKGLVGEQHTQEILD